MRTGEEYSGYYCLLIAIFCDLDVAKAQMLYDYGPEHPVCKKFLERKDKIPAVEELKKKDTGKWMKELWENGYTINEIASAFKCYPSTVKRRIEKYECKEKQGEGDAFT